MTPRSERRTRALDAFIDLILEQGRHPKPEEVAQRADVSIASLYRYFATLDELRRDAIARIMERFADLFEIPDDPRGDRRGRITSFARSRLELHETLHPLQLLGRSVSHDDPGLQRHVEAARQAMADQVRAHFVAELATLTPARRANTVATIAALTSVESWDQFRNGFGRSTAQTVRCWTDAIDGLLPEA